MEEGIIYILTNRAMPDYIKIGFTSRADIKARLKELYTTGVPFQFENHFAMKVSNAKNVEKTLHQIFSIHRENPDREFFRMDPERARLALSLVDGEEIKLKDSELYDQEDLQIIEKSRKSPIPAFKFSMVGIEIGSELTYTRDENIKCTVISDNKVSYEGEELSLTALVKKLLGTNSAINGVRFWMYNGKTLNEIRYELENSFDDE